jgi:hypothetical protein
MKMINEGFALSHYSLSRRKRLAFAGVKKTGMAANVDDGANRPLSRIIRLSLMSPRGMPH